MFNSKRAKKKKNAKTHNHGAAALLLLWWADAQKRDVSAIERKEGNKKISQKQITILTIIEFEQQQQQQFSFLLLPKGRKENAPSSSALDRVF